MTSPIERILDHQQMQAWRTEMRNTSRSVAFTNGCFDLLHRGHLEYLYSASKLADELVIAVNSDQSVRSLKGPNRPVQSEQDRAFALASLRFVSRVCIFDSMRCDKEILVVEPDVYVKAGDYTIESLDKTEFAALTKVGSRIHFESFVNGYSTTKTIEKLSLS